MEKIDMLSEIEQLAQEAVEDGIDLNVAEIPVPNMDAAYLKAKGRAMIVLNKDGTASEQACWLAEQLGHHNTGAERVLRYETISDWKAEARARKWAHDRLLSADAIRIAAENATDIYELAEVLGVTEAFLRDAIDDFKARGLWGLK